MGHSTVVAVADNRHDSRRSEQERILDFWLMVEMFSPQTSPKVNRNNGIVNLDGSEDEPWIKKVPRTRQSTNTKAKSSNTVPQHRVHLGIYQKTHVYREIEKVYPPDPNSYEEWPKGECTMAFLVVDHEGQYVPDSFVLSTTAWAVGQLPHTQAGAPLCKANFDGASDALVKVVEQLLVRIPPEPDADQQEVDSATDSTGLDARSEPDEVPEAEKKAPEPIRLEELKLVLDRIANSLGVTETLAPQDVRVETVLVSTKTSGPDAEFLNSFFIKDLATVAAMIQGTTARSAIGRYLMPEAEACSMVRTDVRQNLDEVRSQTRPEQVPLGRWPAKNKHPLVLSQQFSVNYALATLSNSRGIVGVNGPPGTGKTTMLRDLLAALVVERATRLAQLNSPQQGFAKKPLYSNLKDRPIVVYPPKLKLSGFEVVIASANNGAVENVSLEIPKLEAIDESWRDEATSLDYFQELATVLLSDEENERQAWAMLAARLGNKKNCSEFATIFYWLKEKTGGPSGMRETLDRVAAAEPWPEAKARFKKALKNSQEAQQYRQRVYDAHQTLAVIPNELDELSAALASTDSEVAAAETSAGATRTVYDQWEARRSDLVRQRQDHAAFRPGLLAIVISLGRKYTAWRERDEEYASAISHAETQQGQAFASIAAWEARRAHFTQERDHLSQEMGVLTEKQLELKQFCAEAKSKLGGSMPNTDWQRASREARETGALWTDPGWNAERSALFMEALRLHKVFLLHNSDMVRKNLSAAMDVMKGTPVSHEVALAAWQAFFLAVPVVSTTFASFSRLFSGIGHQELGWLFIDEAGQAAPQQAVGAIWRSRRAVIVGDPHQLEPITTLPFKAEQAMKQGFMLGEEWLAARQSAQKLADRATPIGTWLDDSVSFSRVWVGSPLIVHRRCDEPMFSVSNRIAYQGMMVMRTPKEAADRFDVKYPDMPSSKWIDVPSTGTSKGHWVPAEEKPLVDILNYLKKIEFDMSDVLVICPFRDVAQQVRRLPPSRYEGLRAGTIHTAQGKEASIVILVLGGNPNKPGAKNWAARSANLLNVAGSRAKRRFYVIGDEKSWKEHRFFKDLHQMLGSI